MKTSRKLLAFLLAAILTLSLGTVAFADPETYSITIKRDSSYDTSTSDGTTGTGSGNASYTYYKILEADIGELGTVTEDTGVTAAPGRVAYYVTNETQANALTALKVSDEAGAAVLFKVTKVNDSRWNVELNDESTTAETIAKRLNGMDKTAFTTTSTAERNGANDVVFNNLTPGYYLITSTLGSKLVVQTLGNVTIKEKNTYPSVDKTQTDNATGTYANDDVNVKVGDTIYYKVSVVVPADADADITVTDTMSAGLTPAASNTVTAKIGNDELTKTTGEDPNTTTNWSIEDATNGYKITIKPTTQTLGKTIDFYLTATINENAVKTDTSKKNEVELVYKNYHQKDEVKYKTYATGAIKYDGSKATVTENVLGWKTGVTHGTGDKFTLANAEFKLQFSTDNGTTWNDVTVAKETSYYRTLKSGENAPDPAVIITSDANGQIIIRGLDSDTKYRLVETKAPTGFNLLKDPVALVLTEDTKANVSIDEPASEAVETTTKLTAANIAKIENNAGTELPSTGGIGTTIFYVVGGLLVMAAVVLLITKKRMTREG